MKRLTAVFAASVLAIGLAGCTPPAPPEKPENFNPVREQLEQHGLMQAAAADQQTKVICQFDADMVTSALKAGDRNWFVNGNGRGLMFTFYMCNAVGANGFGDVPYNDAVVHPPEGQASVQVKDAIRTELAAQEAKLCGALTGDPVRDDKFVAQFCAALKPG